MFKKVFFLSFLFLLISFPASADDNPYYDPYNDDEGSGFVAMEAGKWLMLGDARDRVQDPTVIYVTLGFNFSEVFSKSLAELEAIKIGPKIGFGFGNTKSTPTDHQLFYDVLLKLRYTLGSQGNRLRPFISFGPGFLNFREVAAELEGGGGIDYYFGRGSVGLNVQYKELFGSKEIDRGVVLMGTLGYHFGQ